MKRFISLVLLYGVFLFSLSAQATITRFAVVDMNRIIAIYTEPLPESKAFIEKREKFNAEVEKQTKELQEVKDKLTEAQEKGNKNQIKTLETQVQTKTQSLQTYIRTTMAELERDREQILKNNEALVRRITTTIRAVAESEGVSMVLAKDNPAILWHSNSVDLTNKVLERLRGR
jgi:Skp family chaperone for outer membrane proteins